MGLYDVSQKYVNIKINGYLPFSRFLKIHISRGNRENDCFKYLNFFRSNSIHSFILWLGNKGLNSKTTIMEI